jgi:hypothetical protein|tara:strand:+ start:515 stop:757 length:243 start_codon:yes stop_codon:yes gene_type:complete
MKAKPEKWAAESLVKETESKTPLTPKQQREAGELTMEMILSMLPVPGVKKIKSLFKRKGKATGGYVKKYANGNSVRKVRR